MQRIMFAQMSLNLADHAVALDGSFQAQIKASVPVDADKLKAMGYTSKTIPFQLIVETNGELVEMVVDTESIVDVVASETTVVEGSNWGTSVKMRI